MQTSMETHLVYYQSKHILFQTSTVIMGNATSEVRQNIKYKHKDVKASRQQVSNRAVLRALTRPVETGSAVSKAWSCRPNATTPSEDQYVKLCLYWEIEKQPNRRYTEFTEEITQHSYQQNVSAAEGFLSAGSEDKRSWSHSSGG